MKKQTLLYWLSVTLFNMMLLLCIALIFYTSLPIQTTQEITLPKGSITKIVHHLDKQGYPLTIIDKYLLVLIGQPKSGTLEIEQGRMNHINFLYKLTNAKEIVDTLTLIPGETRFIFLEEIANKYNLDKEQLELAYTKLSPYPEAGIVPDTYHISKGIKEKNLITFLVQESEKQYEKMAIEHLKQYDKKAWLRILTIASVIQKEAANNEEMPLVASVIYNRLNMGMALQMDGTLNYGQYSHIKITPKRIRTDKSGFNTYLHTGLPPSPICSVSSQAINAALNPKKTDYLYFMKNKNGVHDFSHSYQEHLKNVNNAK